MKNTQETETIYFSIKGQVVIPRRLRREFEIEEGTRALVWADGDTIVLKPITAQRFKSVRGSLRGRGVLKHLAQNGSKE